MAPELVFSPSDFVAVFNQSLEQLYPLVAVEGELASFRVSRGRWVYFDLKDETAKLASFGSVYNLPGPLEDGLKVRVIGRPRLHPLYGFSLSFESIQPVGAGALKKAADLLRAKLAAEGLFAPERKRPLPVVPARIGLITAAASAAATDFLKILNERWRGVEVLLYDVVVQGTEAPAQLVAALDHFEQISPLPDVLVITRGGGSADDLAAFNDERVVRAIAGSRTPTLVAIGHEVDISLAELAADLRASTPTSAAALVVPDRRQVVAEHQALVELAGQLLQQQIADRRRQLSDDQSWLKEAVSQRLVAARQALDQSRQLLGALDPKAILRRGYALVSAAGRHLASVRQARLGQQLVVALHDGSLATKVEAIRRRNV